MLSDQGGWGLSLFSLIMRSESDFLCVSLLNNSFILNPTRSLKLKIKNVLIPITSHWHKGYFEWMAIEKQQSQGSALSSPHPPIHEAHASFWVLLIPRSLAFSIQDECSHLDIHRASWNTCFLRIFTRDSYLPSHYFSSQNPTALFFVKFSLHGLFSFVEMVNFQVEWLLWGFTSFQWDSGTCENINKSLT